MSDLAVRNTAWNSTKVRAGGMVWPLAAVVLALMVLLPIGWILVVSFQSDTTGEFTLQNYIDAFHSASTRIAVVNSVVLGLWVASISTVVGSLLAWLVTRTDIPFRKTIRALVMASFVTPSFLGAIAWILLASPNAGWLNQLWFRFAGTDVPLFNIFSLGGAVFVICLYAISYPFVFVASALEQAPSEYENAARTLGGGIFRIARVITLPLVMPAILSGFILAFLETLATLGAPAFILIPARTPVITIQIFSMFSEFPPRLGEAAVFGMPLLIITALLLLMQRRLLRRRGYTLITGKGGSFHRVALGTWKWLALALAMLPPLLSVVMPYCAMLLVSLSRAWGKGPWAPGNLSLHWYHSIYFENDSTRDALVHSLVYCAVAATIAVVVASMVAYVRSRRLIRGSAVLGFIAMAPFVVPGIVLAIGFYAAYSRPPIQLVGTAWIMIIAFATQFLPVGYSNGMSMIGALNVDLENVGRILGAGRLRVLSRITVPLLRTSLLSSWMLIFICAFRELSTAIFLFVGSTAVITTKIFDYSSSGNYEALCALGITMMLIIFVVVLVVSRVFGGRSNNLQTVSAA